MGKYRKNRTFLRKAINFVSISQAFGISVSQIRKDFIILHSSDVVCFYLRGQTMDGVTFVLVIYIFFITIIRRHQVILLPDP